MHLSADKKNTSVDTLRTRIQLEVSTQRAALALLQLEREPVVELRSSTQRIEMLVDELFFRISEASESHWHSLQQVAGTLARGFPHSTQHNNRDSRNLLFIRIETIAAKYAKSHKKSLSSLRTGNVSDDDSSILSTDDSIFSKSVRTSITSVEPDDDYSQSVAVNQALNSIQRQFIDYEQQSVDDQNEICKLREKLTQEQYRCEALESKVVNSSELKDQIARLQLELAEKQEAEAFKTNQSERQQYQQDHTIAQLELQLSLEQSRREELEKHHVNFQEQMAQLQLELTEKQQQQQHSQDQIADLELNIRQENTRKEDQIARCREVLNCSLEEAIETMSMNRQEMERVKQQLIQQEAASSSWQSEAAAKEAEVLSLRNHVLTLQQQNAATERFKVPDMSFEEAQRAYTIRESALMLQTASLEAELGSILKEYERLTRHITDFNLERKKYDQQLSEMMDEIHRLQAALADEKTKRVGDENGTTAALRKEFRNLMAGVKAEQQQTMEHEWNQRQHTENELRALKHDLEMKRWEKIDVGVQTGFVAYPLS
ncbi:hypothetical protein DFQ30_005633 [Apophysomyces sp. BC1015]|nr:hypothetical protein DFQ30_005633 [Apophysomyces sp. BC1015]